jgi:hypothetical protein
MEPVDPESVFGGASESYFDRLHCVFIDDVLRDCYG